ncbi:MAG: UPF0182 family protein [Chloroflexi bacterium]|nr:UPF0182 family protein [Chloroflexota bacterium]
MRFDIGGSGDNGDFPSVDAPERVLVLPPVTGTVITWTLVIAGLIGLVVALAVLRGIYTDWLWFDRLGYLSVFTKILWTRVWLFAAGAALFAVAVTVNMVLARRFSRGESVLPVPPETLYWLNRLTLIGAILTAVALCVVFGSVLAGRWETVLQLLDSTSFGVEEPVFGKDASFYVFTLPVLTLVQGWLLAALVALLVATATLYLVYYGLRGAPFTLTPQVKGHLTVLGALVLFALAANHFLDRYDLLFASGGAAFGASYTDVHARLPALLVLTVIAVASGLLLLVTLLPALRGTRGTRLAIGAVGLWVGSALLVGFLYPASIQRFTVQPNELKRESPYIERNIASTRAAFGLDRIDERSFPVTEELTAEVLYRNPETMGNVRLWDPRPLRDTYNQIQFLRLYYSFQDVDVDRYLIDGVLRQVLIGARELQPENLPDEAQSWVNQRLQYTHGFGAAASPVTEFTEEGRPEFFAQDIPPVGVIEVSQPRIYYGERSLSFVVVNSSTEEFDHEPEEGRPIYMNYSGMGGVPLSSLMRRIAYAWEFTDLNILISNQLRSESRIQYRRTIQDRIGHVAPFLELDGDPYLVVEDGTMLWIQDAYTVTDKYPYSTPFQGTFNYMRNSVKVVVDAYHGTLDMYIADPDDPLVLTYQKIFPGLFKPLDTMSPFLQAHLRYPEDLFSVQAEMYFQYHMQDTNQFYNKADQWDIPLEEFFGDTRPVVPYYVIMKLPDEERAEFVLIMPFTPWPTAEKPRMVAWLAARMDQPNYGEMVAFSFPRGAQIDGPSQVEARINQDFEIKQKFALLCSGEARCIRGNLLVVPIEKSILYVEPLYLQSANVRFPELKQVILASSKKVVMESTLDEAIAALVGEPPAGPPVPGEEPTAIEEEIRRIQEALAGVQEGFSNLEEALRDLLEQVEEEKQQ